MSKGEYGEFEIVSLNVSDRTGVRKKPVDSAAFVEGEGIEGDAHAGVLEKRQVSLLAVEEIEAAREALRVKLGRANGASGASAVCAVAGSDGDDPSAIALKPGDFAENVTTRGVALHELPVGTRLEIGGALLEVSQIGKECHAACEIRRLVGDCVMPRKGIFARVLRAGEAKVADRCRYSIG